MNNFCHQNYRLKFKNILFEHFNVTFYEGWIRSNTEMVACRISDQAQRGLVSTDGNSRSWLMWCSLLKKESYSHVISVYWLPDLSISRAC